MSLRIAALAPLVVAFSISAISPIADAQAVDLPWPEKSGPTADGHVALAEAAGLPLAWDEAAKKNIAWKIPLEGEGHSTPVIGHGKLWFTAATEDAANTSSSTPPTAKCCITSCSSKTPIPNQQPINSYASPSCVLEKVRSTRFGTYGTARIDPTTMTVVWQRRGKRRHYRGRFVADRLRKPADPHVRGIDRQYVAALDRTPARPCGRRPVRTITKISTSKGKPKGDSDYHKATHAVGRARGGRPVDHRRLEAAFESTRHRQRNLGPRTRKHDAARGNALSAGPAIINSGSERATLFGLEARRNHARATSRNRTCSGSAEANCTFVSGARRRAAFFITNQGVLYSVDARSGEITPSIGGSFCSRRSSRATSSMADERGPPRSSGPRANRKTRRQHARRRHAELAVRRRRAMYLRRSYLYKSRRPSSRSSIARRRSVPTPRSPRAAACEFRSPSRSR
jgi:hypothetical protein